MHRNRLTIAYGRDQAKNYPRIKGVGSLYSTDFVIADSDEQGLDWVRLENLAREVRKGYRGLYSWYARLATGQKKDSRPLLDHFLNIDCLTHLRPGLYIEAW